MFGKVRIWKTRVSRVQLRDMYLEMFGCRGLGLKEVRLMWV